MARKTNRMYLDLCDYETKHHSRTGEMEIRLKENYAYGLKREVVLKLDRWQLEQLSLAVHELAKKMRDAAVACAKNCGVD